MQTDLLLYKPSGPTAGEFYMTERGAVRILSEHRNWRSSWTQIIPGNFSGAQHSDLLFYDPSTGTGEFYATDGMGGMKLLRQYTNWRRTWTRIVPGQFGGDGRTDLLFYDAAAGTGEFYTVGGAGELTLLRVHTGWRQSWAQIVPGNFGGTGLTDLLFYDQAAGVGEFYATTAGGAITQIAQHTNWRQSWTQIVPGNFGSGSGRTDLFFYAPSTSTGQFHATNGRGGMTELKTIATLRNTWTHIVPGQFGGNGQTDLLFYGGGVGQFYTTTKGAGMTEIGSHENWLESWTHFVPGVFAPPTAVRLHLRFLISEGVYPVDDMLAAMREVYFKAGLRVVVASREALALPGLVDISVGKCQIGIFGHSSTDDIDELYGHRQGAGDNDIVIYFVRSTMPPKAGCASHPSGRPGAIVALNSTRLTLAHEVGHVLGLGHTGDKKRLMYEGGTGKIVDLPPDLTWPEIEQMHRMPYTYSV